jgi:oligoendopeptidase F
MSGLDLYKMADLDMSTTDIIKQAIAHVGRIVDELENSFPESSIPNSKSVLNN